MILNIHKQIYNKYDKNEIENKLFTSTPQSINLYKNNEYKIFIKIFIGVESTYYGFLYHKNKNYLNRILSVFSNDYQIDLNIWNHMMPDSISTPFIFIGE